MREPPPPIWGVDGNAVGVGRFNYIGILILVVVEGPVKGLDSALGRQEGWTMKATGQSGEGQIRSGRSVLDEGDQTTDDGGRRDGGDDDDDIRSQGGRARPGRGGRGHGGGVVVVDSTTQCFFFVFFFLVRPLGAVWLCGCVVLTTHPVPSTP